jgi:rubredoxin
MSVWFCANCDHTYDSVEGDVANDIAPGTNLESLPEDWECPDCGGPKIDFALIQGSPKDGSGWATSNS